MKKKKLTLDELSGVFPVLNIQEQRLVIGGGNGTSSNPFTEYEANRMIEEGVFNGGYVRDESGELSYWLPEVEVWPSGYGDSNDYYYTQGDSYYGDDDPWGAYYYDPDYNPWASDDNPYGLLDLTGDLGTISSAIERHAGLTQVGTNGQLYYETKTGRVFHGNQYVGTTSLEGLAKSVNKYLGPAGAVISVYNVCSAASNNGVQGAIHAGGQELGGWAGAYALGQAGAFVGSCICPGAGTLIGGVLGAIVGSIVGSSAGGAAGDYVIELTF